MNSAFALWFAFGIGVIAGLRSMTAPALVAWSAHLHWIPLQVSALAWMGSTAGVIIFSLLAVIELVADQLPKTPARTAPLGLSTRLVTGALSGAAVAVAGLSILWVGAIAGATGALVGTFGGYNARVKLVRLLHVPDFVIATAEDVVAIAAGLYFASK